MHGCESLFELELLTDKAGKETQFSLLDSNNNLLLQRKAGSYEASSRYTESLCLPKNERSAFTIGGGSGASDFAVFLQGKLIGAGAVTFDPSDALHFDSFEGKSQDSTTRRRGLKSTSNKAPKGHKESNCIQGAPGIQEGIQPRF